MKYDVLACPKFGSGKPMRLRREIKFNPKFPIKIKRNTPPSVLRTWDYPIEVLGDKIDFEQYRNVIRVSWDGCTFKNVLEDSNLRFAYNWKIIDVFGFVDGYHIEQNSTLESVIYVIQTCNEVYFVYESNLEQ